MTVGKFVLVNTYLIQLYQPLNFLGFVYITIKQGLVDMEQMFRLLQRRAGSRRQARRASRWPAHLSEGPPARCAFENVHFGYQPEPRNPERHRASPSRPAASWPIVGPTGAGKSTISRLLFRFYDVTGGRILIDGQDIRDVTQASLRAAIGVVPQDTVLFNDTIRYNIAYGRPGATQEEIEHAARLAQVHDFVLRLPDGYDTTRRRARPEAVGRRKAARRHRPHHPEGPAHPDPGRGHQRARHAAPNRTSSRRCAPSPADRTTLVIAHRLSTVVDADEIIVLQRRPDRRTRHAMRPAGRRADSTPGCGRCRPTEPGDPGPEPADIRGERTMPSDPNPAASRLSHAGAVVDKAIEYMMGQNISSRGDRLGAAGRIDGACWRGRFRTMRSSAS